jgi:hypothetical protein
MPLPTTNATVLPGHVLTKFRVKQIRMAEDFFVGRALQVAGTAGAGQPDPVADRIMSVTVRNIAAGLYSYSSAGFKQQAIMPTSLPFLLWLCLSIETPRITQEEAATLVTDENEAAVTRAILEMLGYSFPNAETEAKNPPKDQQSPPPTSPSPGTTSAKDSAAGE